MSMYGKYPKVKVGDQWVEQNGLNGAPKAWPTTDCSKDKVLTQQHMANETDINTIVKRMEAGRMVNYIDKEPVWDDISEYTDLGTAIMKVKKAQEEFMQLPAEVRSKFRNNPVELIDFLSDENNRKEAEELGLISPKEPAEPATIPPAAGGTTQ